MADDVYIPTGASEREQQIRRRVHAQAEFYRHLMVYVAVIAGLWLINFQQAGWPQAGTSLFRYWAIWPTLGWGIGIAVHGIGTATRAAFISREWEERKVQELMRADDR